MRARIFARLALALAVVSASLPPAGWAMDRTVYAQADTEEKAVIAKLEKLLAEVRLCMLAELYSVMPTDEKNYAKSPGKVALPGGRQVEFAKVVDGARDKYKWSDLWHSVYDKHVMIVGRVYADDIAKLRKANPSMAKHAQDVLAKFKKVDVRALDAFFTEMYSWSERVGNGTNQECKIYGSDHRQYRWGDLFKRCESATWESLKPLWRGNKGLLEMEFGTQISKLKQYNGKEVAKREKAADKKAKADGKKEEKPATSLSPKAFSSAVNSVQNGLKSLPDSARTAFLAALAADVQADSLPDASYTDAKGRLRYVYDELQAANAVPTALELAAKAKADAAVCAEVLARNAKALKGREKGAELRENRKQAMQKAFDAKMAAHEAEQLDHAGAEDLQCILETDQDLVKRVQDPLCREVLMRAAARKYTVDDLFTKAVYDDQGRARNCYDVLKEADQADTAVILMLDAQCYPKLQEEAAKLMGDLDAAREKQKQKRAARVKAALKAYEAEEARRALEKAEKK